MGGRTWGMGTGVGYPHTVGSRAGSEWIRHWAGPSWTGVTSLDGRVLNGCHCWEAELKWIIMLWVGGAWSRDEV